MKFVIPLVTIVVGLSFSVRFLGIYIGIEHLIAIVIPFIGAIAHIVFAAKGYDNARVRVEEPYLGIPAWAWSALVLVMGIFGLFFYWLFHDSRYASRRER